MGGVVVGRRQHELPDAALAFAALEAQLRGERLTLTHVWDTGVDVTVDAELFGAGATAIAHAVPGPVKTALFADHPDLLVLSRDPDARHLSRMLHSLLRHTSCPLAVVASGSPTTITRIVVGVCGTSASAAALRWAAQEAQLHQAELHIVHAWQLRPATLRDALAPAAARQRAAARTEATLIEWVRHARPNLDATVTAQPGGPLDCLLQAAVGADLVVVGLAEHHRFQRLWHGHLADDLSLLADCPTVVVPSRAQAATQPSLG